MQIGCDYPQATVLALCQASGKDVRMVMDFAHGFENSSASALFHKSRIVESS